MSNRLYGVLTKKMGGIKIFTIVCERRERKMKKKLTAAGAAASLFLGLSGFIYHEVIDSNGKVFDKIGQIVSSKKADAAPEIDPREKWLCGQSFTEYRIKGCDGTMLHAYYLPAEKETDKFIFCSHGYRSNALTGFALITKFLHDKGYNVFLIDQRGCGKSGGNHITFGNKESKDCLLWLDFMLETFGKDIEICLYGVSLGSATVMMMTGNPALPENVKFTVADCGYTNAWNEFSNVLGVIGPLKYPILVGADIFCRLFAGFDFRDTNALEGVKHARIPILFIHGGADNFIPPVMCYELYEATSAPYKDLVIIDGAWHAKSYATDSALYEKKFSEFAEKFF